MKLVTFSEIITEQSEIVLHSYLLHLEVNENEIRNHFWYDEIDFIIIMHMHYNQ